MPNTKGEKMKKLNVCIASLALSGCVGTMIPGQIYSDNGQILDFAIEQAYRSGAVTAFNSRTNETFSGRYVGILEEFTSSSTAIAFSGRSSASAFGSSSVSSNIGNTTAYLKGNKGSMLTCKIQIEAGLSPHGIGSCQDQKGQNFRVQF